MKLKPKKRDDKAEQERMKIVSPELEHNLSPEEIEAIAAYSDKVWDWQQRDLLWHIMPVYYIASLFLYFIAFAVIMLVIGATGGNPVIGIVAFLSLFFIIRKIPENLAEPSVRRWAGSHVPRLQKEFPGLSYGQALTIIPRFYVYRSSPKTHSRRLPVYYPLYNEELARECAALTYEAIMSIAHK